MRCACAAASPDPASPSKAITSEPTRTVGETNRYQPFWLVPLARSSTVVEVASGGTRGARSGPGVWGDDAEEWLQNQTPKK